MKKITLSLLFSSIIILNIQKTANSFIITNLGPLQLITTDGSNTFSPGSVILYGNIKIGCSNSDTIQIQGSGINLPTTNNNNLLTINSSGNIATANSSTPISCGALTTSTLNTNSLNCTNTINSGNIICKNLTAANGIGQSIFLGNSSGSINITSSSIINPASNNYNLLMIDSNGSIKTSDANTSITFDQLTANSLTTTGNIICEDLSLNNLNTNGNITCKSLTAGIGTGAIITLGNNSSSIILNSSSIIEPSSNNYNLLMIDSNKRITTSNNTTSLSLGDLIISSLDTLAGQINCGSIISNNINTQNGSINCGSLIAGGGTGQVINLGSNTGNIIVASSNIFYPSTGQIPLYIDNNGSIGTLTSSKIYKNQINKLYTNSNSFDLLQPVSFYYIDDHTKQLQYGFIAEDLENIPTLKETVIYGHDNKPLSINYQAVFVALTADYLATKKAFSDELQQKNNDISELKTKYEIVIKLLNELIAKNNSL